MGHCDSGESPEGQDNPFDFCYCDDSHGSDDDKAEGHDIDIPHLNPRVCQTYGSSSKSTRASTSNPISCDVAAHNETHVFSPPHIQATPDRVDFPGNKKRKQGYQASNLLLRRTGIPDPDTSFFATSKDPKKARTAQAAKWSSEAGGQVHDQAHMYRTLPQIS